MRKIEIEEVKKLELDILDFFAKLCKENGLTYFLAGGTLLGAIRHQGFIPWDDDIDVMMPRRDYEKLKEVFPVHDYYTFLHYTNTHNYPKAFGTINDSRTYKPERRIRKKCHLIGINIDIFPIDSLPDDKKEIHLFFNEISEMARKNFCITYSYGKSDSLLLTLKRNFGILLYRFMESIGLTSVDKMVKKYSALAQRYNDKGTKMCAVTCSYIYGEREVNVKSDYYPVSKTFFEGKEYCIPANYDAYLRGLYGDYMKLPPKEKQVPHHDACFWKY